MTFTHPWAIWIGLFAAALPVLVHWLTRPRPRRLPLSTFRFVREAVQQRRARSRLRDWIVLLLRLAAILTIALAVARPRLGQTPSVVEDEVGDAARVVLFDVSQSMASRAGAAEVLERGRTTAARFLRYRPGLAVNLLFAGARPRTVFSRPSTNFEALRSALSEAECVSERLDCRRCLEAASEMLMPTSAKDTRRRELVIVSDFQRANWARADFSVLPDGTRIHLESVAPERPPENFAVLRASAKSLEFGEPTIRLEVEVGNFSDSRELLPLLVTLGDDTWRFAVECGPDQVATVVEELEVRSSGWQTGSVRLLGTDDALSADDSRRFVVQLREAPHYVLVTRQPASQRPSASHYLECALLPGGSPRGDEAARLTRMEPDRLDATELGAADLVLLAKPGRLSTSEIRLLEELLRHGRPVFYIASDASDAQNLTRLADDGGVPLPVEFLPAAGGLPPRDRALGVIARQAAPFRLLGEPSNMAVEQLRFHGGLISRQLDRGLQDDVLARYDDGSACLVFSSSEAGTFAVLNADLAASNLPRSPLFVVIVSELVGRLTEREAVREEAYCGEASIVHLPSEVASTSELRVVPTARAKNVEEEVPLGRFVDGELGLAWHWPSPDTLGTYEVRQGDSAVFALAVNLHREESRLDYLSEEVLTERLGGGRQVSYRGVHASQPPRDDLWSALLAICIGLLIAEVLSLLVFRT